MSQNAFENGIRKIIPAVLVYVEAKEQILMIHRAARSGDIHRGKWNGLGGKLEADESALEAARRELKEESGLDLDYSFFESRGCLHFPNFKTQKNEDWWVSLFWIHAPESVLSQKIPAISEGQAHWIPKSDILGLSLWPGDKIFLPLLLSHKKIMGTICYENGEVSKSWIDEL